MIRGKVLVSVGLCDAVCPPSSIFAAYNHMECDKHVFVFPYMGHSGHNKFYEAALGEMAKVFGL
jgi:cephalosporin-C deacetylase